MFPNSFTQSMKKIFTAACLSLLSLGAAWAQFTVSGTITNEDGVGVEGVVVGVDLASGDFTITNENGQYQMELPAGSSFDLTPINDTEPLNGVTTFDLVLITKHLNGTEALNSPYKIIAADADKSNSITWNDTIQIRELVWNITTSFPNNTSWRFVPADFVFPNPADPFQTAFPEVVNINNLSSDITADFIAIKVGDVNNSAVTILNPDTSLLSNISGHVFYDVDENCTGSTGDTPLKGWTVKASGANGTYFGTSQTSGFYSIHVPPGTYDVEIIQLNSLWAACTAIVPGVTLGNLATANVNFMEQAVQDCPLMTVDLSTWGVRRCFLSPYFVEYCNQGTVTAEDAYVEITLDSFYENVSSTLPWTSVNGNTYTFDLGDVAPGECGNFQLSFLVSCDAVLGQTHCSSAHVYPDENCLPPLPLWGGGDLLVTGECTGNNVLFTITNKGDDMTEPIPYVVFEDIMIQMQGNGVQLGHDESTTVTAPANGSTWRLQANEVEYHPFETFASATVEGCGTNGSGSFSLGFVNQFPLPDETPFEDIDCQENIGSFDPNDKTGYPYGYDDNHFIEQGQDISYLIRFQNTGTDTAFNVLIVDTLAEHLDPASLRLNGSSHPMEFELEGRGVAKFRFPSIMLPDSNANEAASHGFVKFTISQQPNLAIGTVVENEAGIYFDFNDAVITNRTWHTVGEDLVLEVTENQVFVPGVAVDVFPNPFESSATFLLKGMEAKQGLLKIYDLQGKPVRTLSFTGNKLLFNGSELTAGFYFFKIEEAGNAISSGKLMVK